MTEHADGPVTDKAAWAGADEQDVAAAARGAGETDGAGVVDTDGTGVVNDGTAADDGLEATPEEGAEALSTEDPLAEVRGQLEERTADLQRVSAEFANYRRRVERDRVATVESAKGVVLAELLPIVDDLDRADAHGDVREGPLKVFSDKLRALLTAQGVEAFGVEGEAFDPALHEAVQDESEGSDPVIGTVLRKGYRFGERTLRTAMVTVR